MKEALLHEAFSFGDERHDVADLVLAGIITNEWQLLTMDVARGCALETARDERPSGDELNNALREFRYAHRLIAAADLIEWLIERSLQLQDLQGVLQRRWLRGHCHEELVEPVSGARLASCIWAESLVAGTLQRSSDTLIAWHAGSGWAAIEAAYSATAAMLTETRGAERITSLAIDDAASGLGSLGVADISQRVRRLMLLQAGYHRFSSHAIAANAVDTRLAQHRLDWTVVEGIELSFMLEGAARETRMHVCFDGRTLSEVAEMLGTQTVERRLEIGAAPADISAALLAARQGDLLGPWLDDGCWRVLQLLDKSEPGSAADETLRSRARQELLREMVERLAAGKVVRRGPF